MDRGTSELESEGEKAKKLEEQVYELQKQVNIALKRQLRAKEALYKKDKAVLEQKLEILELQAKESKARYPHLPIDSEENIKKMHETMMSVLRPTEGGVSTQELQLASELHLKEVEGLRAQHAEMLRTLEQQVHELKDSVAARDVTVAELTARLQDTELRSKASEEDHKRLTSTTEALEKLKDKHVCELQRLRQEHERRLEEAKRDHEKEKRELKGQVETLRTALQAAQTKQAREVVRVKDRDTSRSVLKPADTTMQPLQLPIGQSLECGPSRCHRQESSITDTTWYLSLVM